MHKREQACRPQQADARDMAFRLKLNRMAFGAHPSAIDLRDRFGPVVDQGVTGACSAIAVAAAIEFNQISPPFRASWPFLHVAAGRIMRGSRVRWGVAGVAGAGAVNFVEGTSLRTTIKAAVEFGVAAADEWPDPIARPEGWPPADVWEGALQHRVTSYHSLAQGDLESIKTAMCLGMPVICSIELHEQAFSDEVATAGNVPTPPSDWRVWGGHALVLVGFDDYERKFLFRNSWGQDWGVFGYGTLGYDYVGGPHARDFWIVNSGQAPADEE